MKGEHEPVTDDEFVLRLREACLSSPQDVLRVIAPEKRDRYQLARLRVSDLTKLGLSIKPEPIETLHGHAVIPELNATAYAANRLASKVLQKRLAELASRQIVVRADE